MIRSLKAVLVGCGSISRAWLKALTGPESGVTIKGLVDVNINAACKCADEFCLDQCITSEDLEEVLASVDPDIVCNCTIPEAHAQVIQCALSCGCHVITEKPLAPNLEQAQEIVKASEEAGRVCAVMQNRRYNPHIRAIVDFLKKGNIGPLTTLNSDFYLGPHFGGFREEMEHPLILDMAIHTFDAARLITGADPVSVYCHEWNPQGSWYSHGASAAAVFEMTGNIVYTYRGSWCAEGCSTAWESEWRCIGTEGSLLWDGADSLRAETVSGNGFVRNTAELPVPVSKTTDQSVGHKGLLLDVIENIKKGKIPETAASDNIKSLAMVFGCIESAKTGKKVRVEVR